MFTRSFVAGWADMDFNAHMRNTAFLDRAADVRMMFFAANGFPMREFVSRGVGPVIMKDELEYFREVALLQEIDVTLAMAGLATDGSRFLMRNEIFDKAGKACARINSAGGWLDLSARKLAAPPEALRALLESMPRTEDFSKLGSSISAGS